MKILGFLTLYYSALVFLGPVQPAVAQPNLEANNPLTVSQGAAAAITAAHLFASDPEVGASAIFFALAPGGEHGGPPHEGVLTKSGVPLTFSDVFTVDDINNGRLAYQQTVNNCATNDDFQCRLTNSLGKVWSDQGFTTFTFRVNITLVNRAPIASNSVVTIPLGATYQGACVATNPDCFNQPLRYSIVTSPAKGNLTAFNTNSGAFTYTATPGQSGADSFVFQVSDGVLLAAQAGTFTLNIQVGPPVAHPASFETQVGLPLHGTLTATDPNLPVSPFTFSVVSQGTLGTVVITNAGSGGFTYTPAAGRFGSDSFSFKVNNGSDSPPATVSVSIRPRGLAQGNVLLSDFQQRLVAMLHPSNGDMVVISQSNLLALPTGIAYEPRGTILVNDLTNGLIRIHPSTGAQTVLVSHNAGLPYPVGVAVESSGAILVADAVAGVMRFSSAGVLMTNFPRGSLVAPVGVALGTNGQIFVVDAAFFAGQPAANKMVQINPVSLAQTIISTGGLLSSPVSVAVEPDGNLLSGQYGSNSVVRISYPAGGQSVVSAGGLFNAAFGVATTAAGEVFVSSLFGGPIVNMHRLLGTQAAIHPVNFASQGITVVSPSTAPRFTKIARVAPGQFQLQFQSAIGSANTVRATTNVSLPVGAWT
ncbi:MAG TPA: Ig-like domain-containing protein, partial [Verrucomicrobiae bacterium]